MTRVVSDDGSDGKIPSSAGSSSSATFVSGVPRRTYSRVSGCQLEQLCRVLGLEHHIGDYLSLQDALFQPWGEREIPPQPGYPSAIGDDHSPYEYSVAFSRSGMELRILFEAQALVPTAANNQREALAVNDRLASTLGVDFSKFNKVADLFVREEPQPPFSLWHATCLTPGKSPEFKIYLNPAAQGSAAREQLVAEALTRLGFSQRARTFLANVARSGDGRDEIRYFSLDLSARADARVKVYFAHPDATAAQLESVFSSVSSHRKGDVEDFCSDILGYPGPFFGKPFTSCFSFVTGSDVPTAVTLHAPVAHYLPDDAEIAQRVEKYLTKHGLLNGGYAALPEALSAHSLDQGTGVQSYASFRRERSGLRLTAYLSPGLFADDSMSGVRSV